tara:strand:- start:11 stop:373 length:363 start_codon:yes stop_codon:yes gene_type:complete
MTNHIETLNNYLNENGIKSAIWQDRRIYINALYAGKKLDKDIKVYIEIDDPAEQVPEVDATSAVTPLMSGCTVKVFSNANNQSAKWLSNRQKQFKHAIAERLYDIDLLKTAPPEEWEAML